MTQNELNRLIVEAAKASRGYASEFGWPDRDIEEWGVVARSLSRALEQHGVLFFHEVIARGRGNDPSDCEAVTQDGERVAFEVTELVDDAAIQYAKHHNTRFARADWPKDNFLARLGSLIESKGKRYEKLRGGPYAGGYLRRAASIQSRALLNAQPVPPRRERGSVALAHTRSARGHVTGSHRASA